MKRRQLHLKTARHPDPIRAARARRALVKMLAPEVFGLNAESQAVLAESEAYLRGLNSPEENARLDEIAELERRLAELKSKAGAA